MKRKMHKLPKLSTLKKKAWKVFSEYIRRRDTEHGHGHCYTCGDPLHWKEGHAGHAIDGRHNAVLFDEELVKLQCPVCNIWKHGNHKIYTTKLIKEHGMKWWESKLAGSKAIVKYTRQDLIEITALYQSRIEHLNRRAA